MYRTILKRAGYCVVVVALTFSACAEESASGPDALALGPYLQFVGAGMAVVRWRTAESTLGVVEWKDELAAGDKTPDHQLALAQKRLWVDKSHHGGMVGTAHGSARRGLQRNTVYEYRLRFADTSVSPWYECDTTFDYSLPRLPEKLGRLSEQTPVLGMLDSVKAERGYALVLGCEDPGLLRDLARSRELHVIGLDGDAERIDALRATFSAEGLYGSRLSLNVVEDYGAIPFPKHFANLVVMRCPDAATLKSGADLLRPYGGLAWVWSTRAEKEISEGIEWTDLILPATGTATTTGECACGEAEESHGWRALRRLPPADAGEWTHQYGSPDNSARSGEALGGARGTQDLRVRWMGRPGPRAMVDRNPRKPSPLYTQGRLFTQGLHRIIAQDAYNGAILWALEIPALERFNMPRDCSNWCADDGSLYAVVGDACWRLNGATGILEQVYTVDTPDMHWSYVAQTGKLLYGGVTAPEAAYTNFRGESEAGWYDSVAGDNTKKVCSDALFARDKDSGDEAWRYEGGLIVNPTITLAENRVFFVESRTAALKEAPDRRLTGAALWERAYLVALDATTGARLWEHRLNTEPGSVVAYLLHANGKLALSVSHKRYLLYVFDAANGKALWQAEHPWTGSNHSGHMQHPAVLANTVYLEPRGYDLDTGALLTEKMGRHHGCATYLSTNDALIYRGSDRRIAMWDPETEKESTWPRLRPGCWLSTIAGGGMVLSPEAGGGCSCGGWMETSLAFSPEMK